MTDKETSNAPIDKQEDNKSEITVVEREQLSQIGAVLKENRDRASILKPLFALVPSLESIQKDVRPKVCSQLTLRCLRAGDKLIGQEEEIKEFFVVLEGVLQHIPAGQPYDVKVQFCSLP